jgi:acetoin:2,6-dichlorophenolindophenol oxidoreductase subunit alpha
MSTTGAPEAARASLETRRGWLVRMHEIRFFEEECQRLFTDGSVRGSTHLCQGQEAVVVGACAALEEGDSMTCTYRGHGAVLAKGAPLDRTFAEIMGKGEGLCGGKGGSMHLTDVSVGAYGSFAIIGAHLPIAAGLALAERYSGSDRVSLCFFGDGAANIGAFHEALNLASVWKLPVVFVCENNLYGEYSPIARTTPIADLADRADAYAMAKAIVDGNDVDAMYAAVSASVARGRDGEGPTLIEAKTYRHKGHSRTDPAKYRPAGELERWLERDPIVLLERALEAEGVARGTLDDLRAGAEQRVAEALAAAKGWPDPDPSTRFDHVFA